MSSVWIVFDDEEAMDILGVFASADEAEKYAEQVSGDGELVPHGAKYSEYSVPWRLTDRSTTIRI